MDDVRGELDRLRRAWARSRARVLAGRFHLVALGAALVAAFASRVLGPWPVVGALEGRWLLTGAVVVGLALLGPALAFALAGLLHAPRVAFARRLDDSMSWHDAADTALGLAGGGRRPLDAFLTTQTAGRLRGLEPDRLWPREGGGRLPPWVLPGLLLLLFASVLLLPGVTGLLDERGAGRGERAGLGTSPEERPAEPLDADVWQRDHMRLFLRADAPREQPLELRLRWKTDEPLPAAWAGDLVLLFDGEEFPLGALEAERGASVDVAEPLDLGELEALQERLTPGRHVAQALLRPTAGPWRATLESNRLEILLDPDGSGGDGDGEDEQSEPEPQPAGQPEEQPQPEPEPEPEPPPPPPTPEGPDEQPVPPPPGEGPEVVVDPLVRHPDETVLKEDAVVAVPDPEAGLKPPPPVPLSEAMRQFQKIVEHAMGDERLRAADRGFLLRYFRALRDGAGAQKEEGSER